MPRILGIKTVRNLPACQLCITSWNFSLQKQLSGGFLAQAAYVGSHQVHITQRFDLNAGQVLGALSADGLGIVDVSTRDPDLEDVFLSLTSAEQEAA